jgi:hypothetical protein
MRFTHHCIRSLLLAAALGAPVAVLATPGQKDAGVQVRIYDTHHKDYHNWDDRENHAWGLYLSSNHKKDHEFWKSSKKEQSQYWDWRHSHPDHD